KIQSVLHGDVQSQAETTWPSVVDAGSNKLVSPITSETPVSSCQRVKAGTLERLPVLNRRKVGMTSSPHGLHAWGCTRATMARTEGGERASGSESQKTRPSSDRRLQLASVKLESLVIAGQPRRGECVPEPCTHRPSSHEREGGAKSPRRPQGGKRLTSNS